MKYQCLNTYNGYGITKNNIYDVLDYSDLGYVTIINDFGVRDYYLSERFKPISDIREEKLNILLNG